MASHYIKLVFKDANLGKVDDSGNDAHHKGSVPAATSSEEVHKASELEDEPEVAGDEGETVLLLSRLGGLILVLVLVLILIVILGLVCCGLSSSGSSRLLGLAGV